MMKLLIPPEPLVLKKQSKEQKDNAWDIDSLSLWFGNRLPTYLWNDAGWSTPLKAEGYNWQTFLKILSLHKKEMIRWSRNALTWKDFILKLQDTMKDPVFRTILLRRKKPEAAING